MDFNVTEYLKLIFIVADSTSQWTFKKLPLNEFCYNIKEDPKLFSKVIKMLFIFLTLKHDAGYSLYTSIKATYCNRLNVGVDMKTQLCSIKLEQKK